MLFKNTKLTKQEQERAEFLLYSDKVRKLTEKTFKHEYIDNKELRGKGYHLDHKLSIRSGYDQGVPPEMVAHVCNLEMVSSEYNASKGAKSTLTFEELIEMVSQFEDYD
jgi:hypothetical protein